MFLVCCRKGEQGSLVGDDKESTDTNQNVSNLDRRINDLNDHSADDVTAELDKLLGKRFVFICGGLLIINLFSICPSNLTT